MLSLYLSRFRRRLFSAFLLHAFSPKITLACCTISYILGNIRKSRTILLPSRSLNEILASNSWLPETRKYFLFSCYEEEDLYLFPSSRFLVSIFCSSFFDLVKLSLFQLFFLPSLSSSPFCHHLLLLFLLRLPSYILQAFSCCILLIEIRGRRRRKRKVTRSGANS